MVKSLNYNIWLVKIINKLNNQIPGNEPLISQSQRKRKEHIKRKSMTLDGSYDIYEDVQFKEIMEKQRDIALDLKVSLDEVQSSYKR